MVVGACGWRRWLGEKREHCRASHNEVFLVVLEEVFDSILDVLGDIEEEGTQTLPVGGA